MSSEKCLKLIDKIIAEISTVATMEQKIILGDIAAQAMTLIIRYCPASTYFLQGRWEKAIEHFETARMYLEEWRFPFLDQRIEEVEKFLVSTLPIDRQD